MKTLTCPLCGARLLLSRILLLTSKEATESGKKRCLGVILEPVFESLTCHLLAIYLGEVI